MRQLQPGVQLATAARVYFAIQQLIREVRKLGFLLEACAAGPSSLASIAFNSMMILSLGTTECLCLALAVQRDPFPAVEHFRI